MSRLTHPHLKPFWSWLDKHRTLHVTLTALLFLVQIVHLYWLSADVVAQRLGGVSYFQLSGFWETMLAAADYVEIPAIISATLLYASRLREGFSARAWLMILFVNSQWLHLFWITDEFIVEQFTASVRGTLLPSWLAWLALAIDYLELPVIFDTSRRTVAIASGKLRRLRERPL